MYPQAHTTTSPWPDSCALCPIRQAAICGRLDAGALSALYRISRRTKLPPHRAIFEEGDPALSAFQLIEGTAKCYKVLPDGRIHIVGFIMPGDLVGLAAQGLGTQGVYPCSVETLAPSVICQYPIKQLQALCTHHPQLERCLLSRTGDLLNAAQERMVLLSRRSAAERVAQFLVTLMERSEQAGGRPGEAWIPSRQQDIADHLGLTPETVSRIWAEFRRKGLIADRDNRRITIRNKQELCAHAHA